MFRHHAIIRDSIIRGLSGAVFTVAFVAVFMAVFTAVFTPAYAVTLTTGVSAQDAIPVWETDPNGAPALLVLIPGIDPDWWGRHGDPARDLYLRGLLNLSKAADSLWVKKIEALAEPIPAPPDSLWGLWSEKILSSPLGLISCGLESRPGKPDDGICLWISSRLRELDDLSEGLPEGDWIRPPEMRDEIGRTSGILRILRAEEAREILALPPSGLKAFQNLPAALEAHPMARLKRVFLADKLFANAGLYTIAVCRWEFGGFRFGLVQAYRDAYLQIQEAVDGERGEGGEEPESAAFLETMSQSGTLIIDRIDRVLYSLWNEIPSGGSLYLLIGNDTESWMIRRMKD